MLQKIKNYLTAGITLIMFSLPAMLPVTTMAACVGNIQQGVANGVAAASGSKGAGSCGGTSVQGGIKHIAIEVINILSIVVGIVAVIMIIYGGFRYITSGGESGGVSSAKNTLIYAIVGLILVALAQVIVHWVLNTSSNIATPST